jgi:hypothetical protein
VVGVNNDGSLTVSHLNGHGTATIGAEYTREHVRLGYAATAHGHQGDTVDTGVAIVTEATTHRSLYVGATRGRHENWLLVVTDDDTDPAAARDVLERVLTNDRADIPATVQRRNLAHQAPRPRPEDMVAAARRALNEARQAAEPYLEPLRAAQAEARAAQQAVRDADQAISRTPRWRRRGAVSRLHEAYEELDTAEAKVETLERHAAPHTGRIAAADDTLRRAEHDISVARMRHQLDHLLRHPRIPSLERGVEIEPPDLGL